MLRKRKSGKWSFENFLSWLWVGPTTFYTGTLKTYAFFRLQEGLGTSLRASESPSRCCQELFSFLRKNNLLITNSFPLDICFNQRICRTLFLLSSHVPGTRMEMLLVDWSPARAFTLHPTLRASATLAITLSLIFAQIFAWPFQSAMLHYHHTTIEPCPCQWDGQVEWCTCWEPAGAW